MTENILLIAALALATVLTRFLPFWLFPSGKETPPYVEFLGKTLPYATISLLVVYCLKGSFVGLWDSLLNLAAGKSGFRLEKAGVPEFLAAAVIVLLHKWKGNSLVSIGVGTAFYMILVQFVF